MEENKKKDRKVTIFVVVGRLGKSLTLSKVLPIIESNKFDRIIVFREEKGFELEGVEYVTLDFLKKINIKPIIIFLRYFLEPIQLLYYAIKYRPALINGYQLLPKGINSFIVSRLAFTKCMLSSIGGIPEIDTYLKPTWFWKNLNLFILKHADIITTKGKTVTNYIINRGVGQEKIYTFNGAIDTSKFFFDDKIIKEFDLLFIGQLAELKGPDRFVLIVKELTSKFPKIKACIIGEGPMELVVKQMISDLNLTENIEIVGYINNPEGYFKKAKTLVMPSRSEGLATSMLEAMACGCVPVVSDVGCMSEAAKNDITAYLIGDYKNVKEFVNRISFLLLNNEKRNQILTNGINLVNNHYSIKTQSDVFKKIIEKSE